MGNSSKPMHKPLNMSQEDEDNQLNFYIDVEDPNLGLSKIYTCSKMPLCYILKQDKTLDDSKIFNIFKTVESLQSSALITLYGFKLDRKQYCSGFVNDHLIAYWEYYNFYFSDYLKKRVQHGCVYLEQQIWHIIQVCSQGYSIFKKTGTFLDLNTQCMVITPQGKLKICWGNLKSQNTHMKFFKYFDEGFSKNFYYSPEELQCMYFGQRTTKIDFDKCNSFRLGMILLYCFILNDPLEICYNPSLTKINFHLIKQLIQNKVAPSYEEEIVQLVRSLLKQNPSQRPSLMQVYEKYNHKMNPDNELRVCGRGPNQNVKSIENNKEIMRNNSVISDTKTVKLNFSQHRKI